MVDALLVILKKALAAPSKHKVEKLRKKVVEEATRTSLYTKLWNTENATDVFV